MTVLLVKAKAPPKTMNVIIGMNSLVRGAQCLPDFTLKM